jgi:hypothetical protein
MNMRTKTKILILSALMVISMFAMAVMPVSASPGTTTITENASTNPGPTASSGVTTEGGNITNVDLVADSYTERWAGFYGNVTGTINLTDGTDSLYSWDWTPATEGEVIASTEDTNIDWANLANGTAADINSKWFSGSSASDNASNTMFGSTSTFTIGDRTMTNAPAVNTGGSSAYLTAIVKDIESVASKNDLLFVANIINDGTTFNSGTHDFEMMVPTNAAIGATETYYFYVELS